MIKYQALKSPVPLICVGIALYEIGQQVLNHYLGLQIDRLGLLEVLSLAWGVGYLGYHSKLYELENK